MPTRRGWAAIAAGLGFWIGARFVGSDDLHMVAVGILALPFLAALFVQWNRLRLSVHRHLSQARVFPGTRVVASLTVDNQGSVTAPFLLLEDSLPAALGRPARLVVTGIPPGSRQVVSYSFVTRQRGHYQVGPMSISITDPFGLARVRLSAAPASDLVVYPEVEDLEAWAPSMHGAGAGESTVRQLHRSAAEFFTMREYVTGDDLRRIHWPSVARTGKLMIRQDETTRRSVATVFLDNRSSSMGAPGSAAFERGVSVSASVGRLLVRAGFAVHLATVDHSPHLITETALLDFLASVGTVRVRGRGDALRNVRSGSGSDTSLVLITAPPLPGEVASLMRTGTGFGRKLAVFVYPIDPAGMPDEPRQELETRASAARVSLLHGGWDVFVLTPEGRLADVWRSTRKPIGLRAAGVSSS
jgi:uncharacterized protein (DUF58 family)